MDARKSLLEYESPYYLSVGDYTYEITETIGTGGSSIVYKGRRIDKDGCSVNIIVKEFCPYFFKDPNFPTNDKRKICRGFEGFNDKELYIDSSFYLRWEKYKYSFEKSHEIAAKYRNETSQGQIPIDLLRTNNTLYSIFVADSAEVLCAQQVIEPLDFFHILIDVAKELLTFHRASGDELNLHLDINPKNILIQQDFLSKTYNSYEIAPLYKRIHDVYIIDYDSAINIYEVKKWNKYTFHSKVSSLGLEHAPYELKQIANDTYVSFSDAINKLGVHTDLYSLFSVFNELLKNVKFNYDSAEEVRAKEMFLTLYKNICKEGKKGVLHRQNYVKDWLLKGPQSNVFTLLNKALELVADFSGEISLNSLDVVEHKNISFDSIQNKFYLTNLGSVYRGDEKGNIIKLKLSKSCLDKIPKCHPVIKRLDKDIFLKLTLGPVELLDANYMLMFGFLCKDANGYIQCLSNDMISRVKNGEFYDKDKPSFVFNLGNDYFGYVYKNRFTVIKEDEFNNYNIKDPIKIIKINSSTLLVIQRDNNSNYYSIVELQIDSNTGMRTTVFDISCLNWLGKDFSSITISEDLLFVENNEHNKLYYSSFKSPEKLIEMKLPTKSCLDKYLKTKDYFIFNDKNIIYIYIDRDTEYPYWEINMDSTIVSLKKISNSIIIIKTKGGTLKLINLNNRDILDLTDYTLDKYLIQKMDIPNGSFNIYGIDAKTKNEGILFTASCEGNTFFSKRISFKAEEYIKTGEYSIINNRTVPIACYSIKRVLDYDFSYPFLYVLYKVYYKESYILLIECLSINSKNNHIEKVIPLKNGLRTASIIKIYNSFYPDILVVTEDNRMHTVSYKIMTGANDAEYTIDSSIKIDVEMLNKEFANKTMFKGITNREMFALTNFASNNMIPLILNNVLLLWTSKKFICPYYNRVNSNPYNYEYNDDLFFVWTDNEVKLFDINHICMDSNDICHEEFDKLNETQDKQRGKDPSIKTIKVKSDIMQVTSFNENIYIWAISSGETHSVINVLLKCSKEAIWDSNSKEVYPERIISFQAPNSKNMFPGLINNTCIILLGDVICEYNIDTKEETYYVNN